MPNLSIYVDERDAKLLIELLNADDEIAFLLANGPQQWIAKATVSSLSDGRYLLWHWPGGSLRLLSADPAPKLSIEEIVSEGFSRERLAPSEPIPDPWQGWTEMRPGGDPRIPYFGDPPNVVSFDLRTGDPERIALSWFGWIGNHYRIIGSGADAKTERWWKRLRTAMKKHATPVQRFSNPRYARAIVWAFPSAYERIQGGCARDEDPWTTPRSAG